MTIPPKELSLDEAAEAYLLRDEWDGCNDSTIVIDSFKAGAAYRAGVEEKRAQVLVRAEITKLQKDNLLVVSIGEKLADERDELRAEIERLKERK